MTKVGTAPGFLQRGLVRWHLLSLDAPTVAAVWVWFVGWTARTSVPRLLPVLMFGAVWVLYVVDRLLDARVGDGWPVGQSEVLEWRHEFHMKHLRSFVASATVVASGLIPLLGILPARLLVAELALGFCLVAWFATVHRTRLGALPKELVLGPFFAAGVFLPALALGGSGADVLGLGWQAMGFATLCSLNTLSIRAWEQPALPAANRGTALALRMRRPALRMLVAIAVVLALACMIHRESAWAIWCAVALAAALLLALDRTRAGLERTLLRAAADAALLTPVLVALGVRLASGSWQIPLAGLAVPGRH